MADRTQSTREQARQRLLSAWRGEIIAGGVYELIARRMPDREAEILRRMAAAESSHRQRLERRMSELGIAVPDADSVRLPLWLRLQARIAPVDRLLAAREAAEDEEVDDLYKRPTGDAETDRLLRDIRHEERSHSLAVQDIRSRAGTAESHQSTLIPEPSAASGSSPAPSTTPSSPPPAISTTPSSPPPAISTTSGSPPAPSAPPKLPQPALPSAGTLGPQARLDRILGRERWHRTGGGWISGAIYGANDGLAAVFGIVAGVSGATGGSSFVLTAGAAGAVASALSMATGAFLAERSEAEVAAANIERERQEIAEHPEEEREELSLFYQLKGIDQATADAMAAQVARQPDAMLRALSVEEFGGTGEHGNPAQAAIAAGVSTGLGAIVPVIPFVFTTGTVAIVVAAAISLVAHFLVGAAKSLVTLRTWWAAGLEMTVAGVLVGGATYAVGLALPT